MDSEKLRPKHDWPWTYGTEALTELFEMGYRDIDDLKNPRRYVPRHFRPPLLTLKFAQR